MLVLRNFFPMPTFDGEPAPAPAPAPAPGGPAPAPAPAPAPGGPAPAPAPAPAPTPSPNPLATPPTPAPAAFPLSNITDPLHGPLLQQKGWVGEDGTVNVPELAKAYYNANTLISGDSPSIVKLPDPATATPEQWDAVHKAMGRPDDPSGYEIKVDPQGPAVGSDVLEAARPAFHEAGLSPRQAAIMTKHMQATAGAQAQAVADKAAKDETEALTTLKTEWGESWDKNLADGQNAVRALGLDNETLDAVTQNMGTSAIMKLMAAIGKGVPGEGTVPGGPGGGSGDPAGMTPQQAQAEIDRLNADETFLKQYNTAADPMHQQAVQKMNQLFARVAAQPAG